MENYLDLLIKIHNFYYDNYENFIDIIGKEEIKNISNNLYEKIKEFETEIEIIKDEAKPLNIAVVGNFSTGKSTFINSLLGEELLGMQIEPSTAKITHLRFGEKFKIQKIHKDNSTEEITKEQFQNLSVHDSVENKKTKIKELESVSHFQIFYNNSILNKINIYDTPGFSSTDSTDDILTKEWIKKADLLLWLVDINEGGKDDEIKNFNSFTDKHKYIILNKADTKQIDKRINIQNNTNKIFKCSSLLYASKPILNYEIAKKENIATMNEINNKEKRGIEINY